MTTTAEWRCGSRLRKRALAEDVAGAEDLLDAARAMEAFRVRLAASADDEEDGVARLALTQYDGALWIFGDGGVVDQPFQRAGGEE